MKTLKRYELELSFSALVLGGLLVGIASHTHAALGLVGASLVIGAGINAFRH